MSASLLFAGLAVMIVTLREQEEIQEQEEIEEDEQYLE